MCIGTSAFGVSHSVMEKYNMVRSIFTRGAWALGAAVVCVVLGAMNFAAAQECPFADDEIIIYNSPSSVAQSGAAAIVWDCDEGRAALQAIFAKIEQETAEKLAASSDSEREKAEYLKGKFEEVVGEAPTAENVLSAYFKHVNGFVLSFDVPDDAKNQSKKELAKGAALTYILDFNPKAADFYKSLEKYTKVTVEKDADLVFIAKFVINDADELFLGVTQVKDMDKYVVVLATTREMVDKKLERFRASNEFVAKRFGDDKVLGELILKSDLHVKHQDELKKLAKDDPRAVAFLNAVKKIKTARVKAVGVEDSIVYTLEIEATNAEAAQQYRDMGAAAVAMVGLGAPDEMKPVEEFVVGLLKSVEFSVRDDVFTTATLKLNGDHIRAIAEALIWGKIK